MIKQLWQLGRPKRPTVYLQIFCQWLSEMLLVTGLVTVVARYQSGQWSLVGLSLLALETLIVCGYWLFGAQRLAGKWAQAAGEELQARYLSQYLHQTQTAPGNVVQVVQQDLGTIDKLAVFYTTVVPTVCSLVLTGIAMILVTLSLNPLSVLIPLLGVFGVGLGMMLLGKFGDKTNARYVGAFNQMGNRFLDDFSGMNTLIMYQRQDQYAQDFAKDSENFRQKTMRFLVFQLQNLNIMDFCLYGALGWFALVSGKGVLTGRFDLPQATLALALVSTWLIGFRKFGYFIHVFMALSKRAQAIFKNLPAADAADAAPKTPTTPPLQPNQISYTGAVGFDPKQPILTDLAFKFQAGHLMGLVGASGSGKSTLAKTLLKQLPPIAGQLQADGQDLATLSPMQWWQTITYLGPEMVLFNGTIADNLLLGVKTPETSNWQQQLDALNLCQFVKTLPAGYETQVGDNGNQLSGGQRQQIAIARAILADKAVYIFDEVTSNIDADNASIILQAIEILAKERAVLLITHRLPDIERLTELYFIHDGHLTQGSPTQLQQQVPAFADLIAKQAQLLKAVANS
ncbi:cytochrome bd biosynthesis ABC-type transporter, ATPase and permease component [Agrilactobacillus composti DSM 18527 = JCM 14202]|uniref:Cytochrome bd biosynthesis ABC-type transporter, ATPase and permease component n=1 Tax=Agrilactobacillus composti DSM 18527 = JCM 14202 TaxID=1423734 RepID=A0A0R1XJU0_9LACO|nr:ATP-binding cassette domain-containing protein [Agrilactobacillus composti]KRM30458.1 cytochrome bd biosynthesis ABC-type transporter, ATPase and permease component [Agrilactobacillus composti DSM 18527 = JCM 14202]